MVKTIYYYRTLMHDKAFLDRFEKLKKRVSKDDLALVEEIESKVKE